MHRQDEICETICETYALTPCDVLFANVSITGQSSNMSNALLNSVPTLNSSNGAEWLLAMEAYLMSQGLWTSVSEKHPVDSKASTLRVLPANATQVQKDAVIAGVDATT